MVCIQINQSVEYVLIIVEFALIQGALGNLFHHDVDEICWPQPMRLLKLGHVTVQRSMSLTWMGRVSDPGN